MSIMSTISRPQDRPIICTISGDAGTGKTSFAATFPKSIWIRAEDGLASIPAQRRPDAFPLIKNGNDVWEQIMALLQEEHSYQTLVIDSVTSLERIFIQDILDSDPKAKSINTALGGYGAGKNALAGKHQRLRKGAGLLNERKNMNVVFIAHADVETMRLPDADDYQRYSLRMMDTSLPPYVDDVDLVGFIKIATIIRGEEGERKKAVSTGARELIVHATPANISKNRFGIENPISLEWDEIKQGLNPLIDLIPSINNTASVKKEVA